MCHLATCFNYFDSQSEDKQHEILEFYLKVREEGGILDGKTQLSLTKL